MKYISIKNWKEHQHYKDRNVIWIKLYLKLLQSYPFLQLTPAERWCYISLLLLAPTKKNQIVYDLSYLAPFFGNRKRIIVKKTLDKMVKLKLITIKSDSRRIAKRYKEERRGEEKERKDVFFNKSSNTNEIKTTIKRLEEKLKLESSPAKRQKIKDAIAVYKKKL